MATQIHTVTHELRRRLMSGVYAPGERLVELQVSAELGASRTPIRLAFEQLTREGWLERLPTRGFRVKVFEAGVVDDAIDVRGTLEGMAARLVAERGLDTADSERFQQCLAQGQDILQQAARRRMRIDAQRWIAMNADFHATLVRAAGNAVLAGALEHVARSPMAGAAALALHGISPTLEYAFIQRAQQDHEDIVAALNAREGVRAEALMREHARRSRDNKRELLTGQR